MIGIILIIVGILGIIITLLIGTLAFMLDAYDESYERTEDN